MPTKLTVRDIQDKYLKMIRARTRALWDEYHERSRRAETHGASRKELLKLVMSYHKQVERLIKKLSNHGLAEIKRLGLSLEQHPRDAKKEINDY